MTTDDDRLTKLNARCERLHDAIELIARIKTTNSDFLAGTLAWRDVQTMLRENPDESILSLKAQAIRDAIDQVKTVKNGVDVCYVSDLIEYINRELK
jgi:hypothetical protein